MQSAANGIMIFAVRKNWWSFLLIFCSSFQKIYVRFTFLLAGRPRNVTHYYR